MELILKTEEITAVIDGSNRKVIRYTPVLQRQRGYPACSGEMTFAAWERFPEDSEEEHHDAKAYALQNARQVILKFAEGLK
jgi:hypothetical protein